jgi:tetratricopeptide (TPR) repeat protein
MVEVENQEAVLQESRYWSPAYCRAFLNSWWSTTFDDPRAGRKLADIGMELVTKVEDQTGTPQPALRARAFAVLGSSFRRTGHLDETEEAFSKALALYSKLEEPLDEADLYRRMAHLRRDQGRLEEALDFANRAKAVFVAVGDRHNYGRVLNIEGTVHGSAGKTSVALCCFAKALTNLDYRKEPAAFYAASNNFVADLIRHPDPTSEEIADALEELRSLDLRRRRRPSVPAATFCHLEALALLRIGQSGRVVRRLLLEARHQFKELDMPLDGAAVLIDLAAAYLGEARFIDARQATRAALDLVASVPDACEDAVGAFRLYQTAVASRRFEQKLVDDCRDALSHLRSRIPGAEPVDEAVVLRRLRCLVTAALLECSSVEELVRRLEERGVSVAVRPPRGERPGGVGFELDGFRVTGRRLGRSYSLPAIEAKILRQE